MRSATAICPAWRRPACRRGSNTAGSAAAASNDIAATVSQVSSTARVSTTKSAAWPTLTALLLMNASPSRGPRRTGAIPAACSAGSAATSSSPSQAWPSPTSESAMSASVVKSPVPSEPSSRVNGMKPALSAATRASSSSSEIPVPPAPSWFARVAIAARTRSIRSGQPAPHAWLRRSRS